jgi:hypothetical protein
MKKTSMWLAAFCACALLLSVVAVSAIPQAPANVAGAWTITMAPPAGGGGGGNGGGGGGGNGGGGGRGFGGPIVMTFKQDGAKLSGSMPGRNGGPDTVFDGTVTGTDVTWTIKRAGRNAGDPDIVTVYKASVSGDTMKGTSTTGDRPAREFTAARNK